MTIGGLTVGVTPLDMAHAYETIAHGGQRVSGTMAEDGAARRHPGSRSAGSQPLPDGARTDRNTVRPRACCRRASPQTETSMLETVLQYGTGRAAAIGQFAAGKTGTTSNYGDAWFVGWDSKYTVAVWVGYPEQAVPMTTDFNGGPVLGGTFPALIWHDFMTSALQIDKNRAEAAAAKLGVGQATGAGEPRPARHRSGAASPSTGTTAAQALDSSPAGSEQATGEAAPRRAPAATAARRRARRRHPLNAPPTAPPRRPPAPPRRAPPAARASRRRRRAPGARASADAAAASRRRLSRDARPAAARRCGSPATQKRQGSSTARVIPTRVPSHDLRAPASRARAARIADRAAAQVAAVLGERDAERLRELARPRAQLRSRAAAPSAARARASARSPARGASARISTAAPTPSGSQTAFSSAWTP